MPGEPANGQPNPVSENVVSSAVAQPSRLVTTLAGIHVVLGAIWILFGGFVFLFLWLIAFGMGGNASYEALLVALLVSLAFFFVVAIPGLVSVLVGYGLFRRRRSSRICCLIFGGFSVLAAGQSLVVGFWEGEVEVIMSAGILGGYALLVFSILLQKRYAAEFTQR